MGIFVDSFLKIILFQHQDNFQRNITELFTVRAFVIHRMHKLTNLLKFEIDRPSAHKKIVKNRITPNRKLV